MPEISKEEMKKCIRTKHCLWCGHDRGDYCPVPDAIIALIESSGEKPRTFDEDCLCFPGSAYGPSSSGDGGLAQKILTVEQKAEMVEAYNDMVLEIKKNTPRFLWHYRAIRAMRRMIDGEYVSSGENPRPKVTRRDVAFMTQKIIDADKHNQAVSEIERQLRSLGIEVSEEKE